jgi:membrane dipeptidase
VPARTIREEPAAWARWLSISEDAVSAYLASEVIDLHIDSFIWTRIFGYDLCREHGRGPLGACFFSQVDFPRALKAGLAGATWIITTNPLRGARSRGQAFVRNLTRLRTLLASHPGIAVVRNAADFRRAREQGHHAAFIGIQGGNALERPQDLAASLAEGWVLRITLVHLTNSGLGQTSSPLGSWPARDFPREGLDYVRALNDARVFVDLAHIGRAGFFAALSAHDPSLPPIVTHTGVAGVYPHWRNLDDEQLRAIADRGGTIGVMYHSSFLGDPAFGGRCLTVFRHLAHIIETVGEDHASLGSDWDGAIIPPRDMPTCLELPRLVQLMLEHGWGLERIRKVLGGNFLRCVAALRGPAT